jgi:uncharacterized protein (DUF2235 family)
MPDAPAIAEKPPRKRIAVFLDGTWNTVADNTNVWRLKSLCASRSADALQQLVYYDAGIGTQFGEKIRGGMFGYGLDDVIIHAYEWLIDHYNPDDEIFIFGFSRGAYTARSLAGFIAKCGLLKPGAPLGVRQLYSRYRRNETTIWTLADDREKGVLKRTTLEEEWMLKYSMRVPIEVVAVWDTVGALGVPAFHISGVSRSTFGFLHTGLRLSIRHGFHALAIDEHRAAFSPTLWTVRRPKDPNAPVAKPRLLESVEQRWFIGAHANVGGGCESDLLAQIPLRWVMRKASLRGLSFRTDVELDGNSNEAPISDSYREFMRRAYSWISPRYYRPIAAPQTETEDAVESTVNETIDRSVFDRWRVLSSYRPPNLVRWAQDHKIDPASLKTSVSATNPQTGVPD